ncbi:MAG: hypothetical protein ABIK78_04785 [candidate division WOR-3 bacterium]
MRIFIFFLLISFTLFSVPLDPNPSWYYLCAFPRDTAFGDIDNNGLVLKSDTFIGNGVRKLFYFRERPVQRLLEIKVNNTPISVSNYVIDLYNGWFTLKEKPSQSSQIIVTYYYSLDLNLAFSGCYLFLNRRASEIKEKEVNKKEVTNKNYEIYNILGIKVKATKLKKEFIFLRKATNKRRF